MGYIVEITEDKLEGLSEHIEKGLRHLGKAMQCVDEWAQESYGEWASVATDVAMASAEGIVGVILADVICSPSVSRAACLRPAFV